MNSKPNQILIGIIFILVGIFALMHNMVRVNYGAVMLLGAGLAFLLLYKTKRKNWSLGFGIYALFIGGISMAVSYLGLSRSFAALLISGMFFLAPGFVFLILFYDKNKRGLLIPSCLFVWFGFYIICFCHPQFHTLNPGAFFIFLGFAFASMAILGSTFLGKFFIYFAVGLIAFGLFVLFGFSGVKMLFLLVAGAIILIGLIIILKAVFGKKQ